MNIEKYYQIQIENHKLYVFQSRPERKPPDSLNEDMNSISSQPIGNTLCSFNHIFSMNS